MYRRRHPAPPAAARLRPIVQCLALLASLACVPAHALDKNPGASSRGQQPSAISDAEGAAVTPSLIETKLKEAEAATDLDEATKGKLAEQYRKILSNLEAKKSYEAKAAAFARALEEAPEETARLRADIANAPDQPKLEPAAPDTPLQAVEQLLAKQLADTTFEETRLATLEKSLEAGAKRPGEVRTRLAEAKRQIDEIDTALAAPAVEGEPVDLTQARRWALQTARTALIVEGRMLEQEQASLGVRTDLLRAKRDKSTLDLKDLKARQQALEAAANERRKASAVQARDEAKEAEREATDKDPLVLELARQNTALSEDLTNLTSSMDALDKQRTAIQAEAQRIDDEFRSARERLEIVGTNSALGQILGDKRRQLPDLRTYRRAIAKREEQIAESTLTEIRFREERRQLRDLDAYLDQAVSDIPEAGRARVRAEIKPLLEQRIGILDSLQTASATYIRALSEINFSAGQLLQTASAYDSYLSERLLWVRSVLPFDWSAIAGLPAAVAWLFSPASWIDVAQTLAYQARHSLALWGLSLVVAVLFVRRPTLRRAILATAEPLRRIRTDRFAYTLEAIALSAIVAAPVSLLLALIGWQLAISADAATFTKHVGQGMVSIAVTLYYLRSFRVLCTPGGVADKHFRWPTEVLARLRRSFDWLVFFLLPIGFVAQVIYNSDESQHAGSLGRVAVLILLLGLALFFARLLHPTSGPLKHLLAEHPSGWANRLRKLWYPLVVGIPLALAGLALAGFLHTAGALLQSIVHSLWLALGLIVVHQAIARWLLVTRRSLALEAALERAAARKAEAPKKAAEEGELLQVEEPVVNLASLDHQTRKLIGALVLAAGLIGLWMVWSEILPAFTFLDRFPLWHHAGVVDGEERMVPVTLADLLLVLTIVLTAAVAGRNLPALIEILLLQYTEMSSGGRYTVTTLTSYGITATAFLLIFSILGLSWSQVQWLVAALGVGIGFGLQEIVANFISGLIILFERPVRVGDIITIGGTTGTVSRIQIRATTIRNWDQQELLVPNKQFITGELLNWTLSDQTNRVVVTVGVEYGTDTRTAMALLAEAAREHPRVLKDPPPLISFEGFGDNALTLVLRCYLGALEGRLGVTTELHQAVYDKLQAAGIAIAFPQRDVHLTTTEPLDVRVWRTPDSGIDRRLDGPTSAEGTSQ
jgi:potassium-dependent mechanosensitive channel